MPGGKFARANRAKREQKAAAAAAGATDAAPAQTQNRRKKAPPKKKDPWAAALAKARQAASTGADLAAPPPPPTSPLTKAPVSAGAADAMNEGLDLTPAWMRTKVDDEDDTDDGVSLPKAKPLKNAKILPAHQKAATVVGGEDSWQGGSWTWLAQTGQRPQTLMERLAQLPESLPGGPVPDYFVPGPGFEGEETAEELRERFSKDPSGAVPPPAPKPPPHPVPPPPRVLQKPKPSPPPKPTPPKPTPPPQPSPPPQPKPRAVPKPPPVPIRQGNPVLVLADMNGTLVHRSKTKLNCKAEPACEANKTFYYARPGAKDLIQFLLHAARTTEEGRRRVVFAFYTSMREANARPIADYLTGGRRVDIYERKFNKADPSGEHDYDTMRDLPSVWSSVKPASARGFNEENTVVIDDTLRKMRELPHNVLVVPPFEEDAVKKGTDDIMDYVKVYLDMLLDEEVQESLDVRETLKARPLRLGFL